ncbi:MAG: hypothetical protein KAT58_06455 [candidate division Zixibacteria bacterium]|nr:hypothetical protein [candidate division Zixibacteria bacterium]
MIFGLVRVFKTDTSDPEAVVGRYLSHWQVDNSTGMYPLISTRAKSEWARQKTTNAFDYYSRYAGNHEDLIHWQIESRSIGQNTGRFTVSLGFRDLVGRETERRSIFYLVREEDGWRVDGLQQGSGYALP